MAKESHLSNLVLTQPPCSQKCSHCETWNALDQWEISLHIVSPWSCPAFLSEFRFIQDFPKTLGYLFSCKFAIGCKVKWVKFFKTKFCCSDLFYLNMRSNKNAASEEHFRTRAKTGSFLDDLSDCSLTGVFDRGFLHIFLCCLRSYSM